MLKNYNCKNQMTLDDFLNNESVPEISIEDLAVECIMRGTGFTNGKKRVSALYQKDMTPSERAVAIKREYGQGGAGWPLKGYGLHGYETFNSKGINLEYRDEKGEHTTLISWEKVEKIIHTLVTSGKYMERTC